MNLRKHRQNERLKRTTQRRVDALLTFPALMAALQRGLDALSECTIALASKLWQWTQTVETLQREQAGGADAD